jgi:hypothetical protein
MDRIDLIGRRIRFSPTNKKVEFESSVSTTQVTCALAFLIWREFRKQPCIDKYEKEEMMKRFWVNAEVFCPGIFYTRAFETVPCP